MIASTGKGIMDPWGRTFDLRDPQCEDCDRSIVMRFGDGEAPPQYCPSCAADWERLHNAGKMFEIIEGE